MSTTVVREQATEPGYVLSRWTIPFAGLLLTLMGGISYAWGVFIVPLETTFGWTRSQAALPLSVYLFVFCTVGMIYGGILQDKYGPRKIAAAGGVFFFVSYLLASRIESFPYVWYLLLTYSLIGGVGCGLAYCVAVPTARKWFPDKPTTAISIAVVGFGIAAVIFAPILSNMIAVRGIPNTFLFLGMVTGAVTLFGAWLVRNPPDGWAPPGWEPSKGTTAFKSLREEDATLSEALKDPLFYWLWIGFVFIIFGGLLAMAHVTPYGVSILGLERPAAALAMVFFGLSNGFGRFLMGLLAEKVGIQQVMFVVYLLSGATFLAFNTIATTPAMLYASALVFGLGFATTLGLFPTLVNIAFGTKNLGAIYGALITAFAVSAFFGPMVGAVLFDRTGTYVVPFAVAGILTLVGWCINLFVYKLKYKMS